MLGARLVTRVDLGQRLAVFDQISSLREAPDPDGMVDRVLLRPPSRAELERHAADAERGDACDEPCSIGGQLRAHGCLAEHVERGVAALCCDPALVRGESGPVLDCSLGPARALVGVDAEIGERDESPRRLNRE